MEPTISVIMPVYNAGTRLGEAVDSVCRQEFTGWELLLVDDGSTDGSARICDEAAARDGRIRAFHQANAGICAARNTGLAAARGEYLAFCDDDDRYLPAFLSTALALAQKHGVDAVRMDYRLEREQPDGSWRELPHAAGAPCLLKRPDGGLAYDAFLRGAGPMFVWNALYRRAAVGELRFDTACRCGLEDFVFNAAFHEKASSLAYAPAVAYYHREHRGSTSTNLALPTLQGRFAALAPWMKAEYRAAKAWCAAGELNAVWNERKAGAITFLMHQLRDAGADAATAKTAWTTLRAALDGEAPREKFDFLDVAGQNRKQELAILLYRLHLTGLYRFLGN